jgi:hypothetical protein
MVRGNIWHARGVVVLSLMLLVGSPAARAVEFAGGTGEPNDPFLIATPEQLAGADFNQPGVHFRLSQDIDMAGRDYPDKDILRCHFDGAKHSIRNVRLLGRPHFFGEVASDGVITNVILDSIDVASYGSEAGAMATVNSGTISDCGASGWVIGVRAPIVGGLVGHNHGSIRNCWFDGWVTTYRDTPDGTPCVGGLVGWNEGTVSACYARGTVEAQTGVGGLVGRNGWRWPGKEPPQISDCYAMATVWAEYGAGGLVGDNDGTLVNCYAAGAVCGECGGGLVGMARWYPGNRASFCLWEMGVCGEVSAGGLGVFFLGSWPRWFYAFNGWAGNPNWVFRTGDDADYPHLVWEGTEGTPILDLEPPPKLFWPFPGSGSKEDPYRITTVYEYGWLTMLSILWDKHYVLAADLDFAGGEIVGGGLGVCPGAAFAGTFDGNGHVMRNISIKPRDHMSSSWYATVWNGGVFGYVTGTIRNLAVENVNVTVGPKSRCIGLLAGTSEGSVENCYVSGSITAGESSEYIGKVVGYSTHDIVDCQAKAWIIAGEGSTHVGELVGNED